MNADDWRAVVVQFRRDLHRIPELGFSELKTSAYLRDRLAEMGLSARPMAGTGLIADIAGGRGPGRTVALRADMDGLPVQEETTLSFPSQHQGVMHACGHDAHMAMVLAAALRLQAARDDYRGTVRVLFQPSEERPPGGALKMIAEGALDGVDEIYGLHVWATQPTGTVALSEGPQMANDDEFAIRIFGRGGHGSEPESTRDAALIAAQTIVNLQTIVSRRIPARRPVVVTCGTISAGTAFNIVAERAQITGTVRTYDEAMRARVETELRHIAVTTAQLVGADAEVVYTHGYPAVVNHATAVSKWRDALAADQWIAVSESEPKLAAEDFSYYLQKVPGAFMFVGAAPIEGEPYPQHSSHLEINEDALLVGTQALVRIARVGLV